MLANIIRNVKKTATGGTGGGVVTGGDPYFSAVSLLLPMDGSDGSTTFTDASSNAIALTPTGSPQISTSQSKYGGASASFPTNQSYLTAPSSSAWAFGTGDFTVEFWIYITSNQNSQGIIGNRQNISSAATWEILFYTTNNRIEFHSGAAIILQSTSTVPLNTWSHVAFCRSSGTLRAFLNGVQVGSVANANDYSTAATLNINRDLNAYASSNGITGNLDDLRISKFARYTSAFSPPSQAHPTYASSTPADPYYGQTSLLLHMDGANGSTSFVDSGPNAIALTAVGNTQISTTQAKYGGASAYFDGSADYLSFPTSDKFNFGSGDFTVEFWYYYNGTPQAAARLFQSRSGDVYAGLSITHKFTNIGTGLAFGSSMNGSTWAYNSGETGTLAVNANAWTHVAVVRSGTVLYCYINGVQNTVFASYAGSLYYNAADICVIGGQSGTSRSINGYIDDFRVTKYARYNSNFTLPTQALPEYLSGNDRYYSNVSLLLHMDGANGSTTFTDNSLTGYTITKYGTAAVSTTQSKYGGSSAYFDGSGARLGLSTTAIDFGAGDFTAECWVYLNAAPSSDYGQVIGKQVYGTSCSWLIHITTARVLSFLWNNGVNVLSSGTALNLNQWYHIAVSRSGSTVRIFVDGAQVASGAISYTFSSSTEFTVGSSSNDNANARLNAYIDEIRLTKLARYTAAFTPPTQAFSNS